ncbi:MAG: hypothetical protein CMH13_08810 [Martelella sp.]|uniref:hypothetical protein n=1 Tax=unclassified Martelella TaxID=2629616 RepID=UPI000C6B7C3C|nr:hypothetical protein [Martelella sp.]MAU20619.1 hypothetical protein [Martelella sp.]|tara:strand:+ start:2137 stop:2769 length:633 start_codon:yes stop_codon:yes gene_type:complete
MKTLAQFFDHLPLLPMRWEIRRNDELSGVGSGVVFQAELAPPLWSAAIALQPVRLPEANEISALVNGLLGVQEPFLFRDPYLCGPKLDPGGAGLVGATVTVVAANGRSLSLGGLPSGYRLSIGDKIQIVTSGGTHAFVEVSENVVATAGGTTGAFQVFPRLSVSVSAGATCTLARPACSCIIMPGSLQSGTSSGNIVSGIAFRIVQKRGV